MSEAPLVAHIIYALSTGGLENGLVNIINRSPRDRYRHIIICITSAGEFAGRITADNVEVIELHKREGTDLRFYRRLRQLLYRLRPSIVHSRNMAALEAQLCSLGLNVRRVHGEHGREINDLDGSNWKYLQFRRLMRLFIHRYIAVSRDLQQWLIDSVKVREERISQIYNGVDQERFKPGQARSMALLPEHWQTQSDLLVVGTVGRLTPVKDQQLLLRAVAKMRVDYPSLAPRVKLILVGDGPLRAELTQLVDELGLANVAWLAGDREDVPELLSTLDIFVLPSLAEGISNTVLEAMASGLPVIATASGGNVELVKEGVNGRLVPVGEVDALCQALATLLENDELRQRLGENAREGVRERFQWDQAVASYLGVYDELLQVGSGASLENVG